MLVAFRALSKLFRAPSQLVTNIFYLFTVMVGTRGLFGTSTKRHSSPARRRRNLRRCKVRRGKRSLLHEQGCASQLFQKESRDLAADCHLPSEKDLINVDKLFHRDIQSWRQRRSQYWENIECQSKDDSDRPKRVRHLLPLPLLLVVETLGYRLREFHD